MYFIFSIYCDVLKNWNIQKSAIYFTSDEWKNQVKNKMWKRKKRKEAERI